MAAAISAAATAVWHAAEAEAEQIKTAQAFWKFLGGNDIDGNCPYGSKMIQPYLLSVWINGNGFLAGT